MVRDAWAEAELGTEASGLWPSQGPLQLTCSVSISMVEEIGATSKDAIFVDSSASAVPAVVRARVVGLTLGARGAMAYGFR